MTSVDLIMQNISYKAMKPAMGKAQVFFSNYNIMAFIKISIKSVEFNTSDILFSKFSIIKVSSY